MHSNATVLRNRLIGRARLRHLQVLVQVAELGSAKRAAEAVGLTQPAVTQVLADLEALLECQLFLRHARGMRATQVGAALLPIARRILSSIDDGAEQVVSMTGKSSGVVRIAAISAAMSGLLVRALPVFSHLHPEVLLQLREADALQQATLVERGEVDISMCRAPGVTPQDWRFVPLIEDRFAVVAGPAHPLLRRKAVGLDELRKASWLLAPAGTAARRAFDHLFANDASSPKTSSVVTNVPAMLWAMLTHAGPQADDIRRPPTQAHEQSGKARLAHAPLLCVLPATFARQLVDAGHVRELSLAMELAFEPIGMLLPLSEPGDAVRKLAGFLETFAAQDGSQAAAAARRRPAKARPP